MLRLSSHLVVLQVIVKDDVGQDVNFVFPSYSENKFVLPHFFHILKLTFKEESENKLE